MTDSKEEIDWLEALCARQRLDVVGDLAGGVAHELNNALSVVSGYQELLLEALEDGDDDTRERLQTIHNWTATALLVARRLYDTSRYLRDGEGPAPLQAVVTEAVELCRYRCEREQILLICDADDAAVRGARVACPPGELMQALVQLLQNARESLARTGGEGGTIRVSMELEEGEVRLRVEDDGPGVAADEAERVFEIGVSAKVDDPGAGLGLPVARRIVERGGGSLRCQPGSDTAGGDFLLCLPIPDLTAERIAADLTALGVRRGGLLLVHASLSSLGHVPGGAETVIAGHERALGSAGTLLLPGLSYKTVHADQPCFDRDTTPSCVGAIPEHFRTRPGTLRSGAPTHSVCASGPAAAGLVAEHHLDDTPVGRRSPFRALRDAGGQALFLGCGLRPNTSMHGVEELAEAPYLFGDTVTYQVRLDDTVHEVPVRRHAFGPWAQRYERLADHLPAAALRQGPVLQATAQLLEADAMWATGLAVLRRDPYAFVERRPSPSA